MHYYMYIYLQVPVPDREIGSYIRRYWSGGRVVHTPKYVLVLTIVLAATSDFLYR